MHEVRNYIEHTMNMEYDRIEREFHKPLHLTMSLKPMISSVSPDLWHPNIPITRHLVIIDKYYRIFDYIEIYNEILAHKNKKPIHFGIGYTYRGDANMEINERNRYRYLRLFRFMGNKWHHRSRPRLYISKRERAESEDIPNNIITDIAEECNISENMIEKACRSMRSERKFFIGEYTYRYNKHRSWKDHKHPAQWSKANTNIRRYSKAEMIMNQTLNEYNSYLDTEIAV